MKNDNDQLLNKLKNLPNDSGVYQYFDVHGKLLYVGKAKNLKNRVKSYFSFTPTLRPAPKLSPRITKMLYEVASLEYIIVDNEHDALILENSLIKQLKPKYNILLRDDKTYPYIYIDYDEPFPRFEITRKVVKGNVEYFGPFSSGARDLLDSVYEALPLVQKKSCVKGGKACLFYQIKKCHAPCEGKITREEYDTIIAGAKELIVNKNKIIKLLTEKMATLAEDLRFEEAGKIRDKINTITKSNITSAIDLAKDSDLDIFALAHNEQKAIMVMMFTRGGRIISSDYVSFKVGESFDVSEAYKRAIINYYNHDILLPPKSILLADEIEESEELTEFINEKFQRKIELTTPKIGIKRKITAVATKNAEELLKTSASPNTILLSQIQELFNLSNLPTKIEIFDNSQMMGQATVGAMVVWEESWVKSEYRHYNLESKDDYSQMQEMLTHRAMSFEKVSPPELWILDGGKALLDLAKDIIASSGANVDVIAIAKEKVDAKAYRAKGGAKDTIYYDDKKINLSTDDKRLQLIQRLRDEAHRFVIEYHRKTKRKEDKSISLLNIHGVGEGKIKKLLNYFGTFEKIKQANINELSNIINPKDAENVYNFFKEENDV